MSCSPLDLRDYFLKELPEPDRRQVDVHVKACRSCRAELERLEATRIALCSLPDEEIPQRIAFVSDKIFEPSGWRRWWTAFWSSGGRLGFASAAMLSAAILFSALTRPAPAPAPAHQVTSAALQQEIDGRVREAVRQASAEMASQQEKKTAEIVAALERRYEFDRKGLILAMEKNLDYMQKRLSRYVVAANDYGPPRSGSGELR
jgi:anti-sigma factor RsiW